MHVDSRRTSRPSRAPDRALLSVARPARGLRHRRRRRPGRRRRVASTSTGGEVFAIVGESGSGKSVTAMSILGLLPDDRGRGAARSCGRATTCCARRRGRLRKIRGRRDRHDLPGPAHRAEPGAHGRQADRRDGPRPRRASTARQALRRAIEMLDLVGIPAARASGSTMYPHEFSGGMRQRAMIAMAIAVRARPAHRRRADHRPRRDRAGAGARGAARHQGRDRLGHHAHHPRPRRRRRASPTASW